MLATTVTVPSWLIPGIILAAIGAVATLVTRAVFHSFREWIKDWFESILAEVKPNGGNTDKLGDRVVQVQVEQKKVKSDLAAFNGTLQDAVTRFESGVAGLYPRMDSIEQEQSRVKDELISLKKGGSDPEATA